MYMSITLFVNALIISTFFHTLIAPAESSTDRVRQPNSTTTNLTPSPVQQRLSSDAWEYLAAHNAVRKTKGVPPLQWSGNLAQFAQKWADERINDCNHHHHSGGPYGENTLWEQYDEKTPAKVAQVWINEEKNYDHANKDCMCKPERSQCMCGHYTQLVWSTTKSVGCGNVTCNNELGFLVVCSYNPPGNYVNENPFQNTLPLSSTGAATRPHKKRSRTSRARKSPVLP